MVYVHVPCARVVLEEDYVNARTDATGGRAVEQIATTVAHMVQALAPKTTDLPAKPATTNADFLTVIQLRIDQIVAELRSTFGGSKASNGRATTSRVDVASGCDGERALVRLQVHGLRVAKEVFASGLPIYSAHSRLFDTRG